MRVPNSADWPTLKAKVSVSFAVYMNLTRILRMMEIKHFLLSLFRTESGYLSLAAILTNREAH